MEQWISVENTTTTEQLDQWISVENTTTTEQLDQWISGTVEQCRKYYYNRTISWYMIIF